MLYECWLFDCLLSSLKPQTDSHSNAMNVNDVMNESLEPGGNWGPRLSALSPAPYSVQHKSQQLES